MIHQAIELLTPFGQVNTQQLVVDFEDVTTLTVERHDYKILAAFDECSQPQVRIWQHGALVMDTRDSLEACLIAFNQ